MVVSDYSDADLFENTEGLEALLSEPTTILSKRNRTEDSNEAGEDEASANIHDYSVVGGEVDESEDAWGFFFSLMEITCLLEIFI